MARYYRSLMMLAGAAAAAVATVVADADTASLAAWIGVGVALVNAFNVYLAPDLPAYPWIKPVVAFVGVGLQALVGYESDNTITGQEVALVVIALASWLGVSATKNAGPAAA